jgi:hypothetical protein
VGKSKLYRARSAANTKRGGGTGKSIIYSNFSHNIEPSSAVESNIKVYIPKEYFKHTGYLQEGEEPERSELKSRASNKSRQTHTKKSQTPFKERFNEKLEYPHAASQKSG